jgi:hypothetical protein
MSGRTQHCVAVATTVAALLLALLASGDSAQAQQLPQIDEGKVTAARIRKLDGKHIALYTDLPAQQEIDELPQVFDAAVPLWCQYFGIDTANTAGWKVIGCVMQEKERFVAAGLLPGGLPPFPNGYSRGSELWLYDQPSGYYRRHLLLHEGTHCFMQQWLGGAGPPWYMEGIAELLATHRWQQGRLTLAIMPMNRDETPYWGRIKIVKDEAAAGRRMTLDEIMRYDAKAHLRNEPYGWCWAAAAFLDQHPLTQSEFRALKSRTRESSAEFSKRFAESLKARWPHINEEWQLFVAECDYGYDVARAALVRKAAVELPAAGAAVEVAADRGWQSSGFRLTAGKKYALSAGGRYFVGNQPKPWPCEPAGVTIRYHRGQPLGKLMFCLSDLDGQPAATSPLLDPQPIGLGGQISPAATGTLYLKINEAASGLADNSGRLQVRIQPAP